MDNKNKTLFAKYVVNRIQDELSSELNEFLNVISNKGNKNYTYLSIRISATKTRSFIIELSRWIGSYGNNVTCRVTYCGWQSLFGEQTIKEEDFDTQALRLLMYRSILETINTILKLEVKDNKNNRGSNIYIAGPNAQFSMRIKGVYPKGRERVVRLLLGYLSKGSLHAKLYK